MKWWARLRATERRWRADVMWRGTVWSMLVTVAIMVLALGLLALLQLLIRGEVNWS